jgi:hypothetical protein
MIENVLVMKIILLQNPIINKTSQPKVQPIGGLVIKGLVVVIIKIGNGLTRPNPNDAFVPKSLGRLKLN